MEKEGFNFMPLEAHLSAKSSRIWNYCSKKNDAVIIVSKLEPLDKNRMAHIMSSSFESDLLKLKCESSMRRPIFIQ